MAAEAVFRIKEVENEGKELIHEAKESAKQILAAAESEGKMRREALIEQAMRARAELLAEATRKAQKDCETLDLRSVSEQEAILDPGKDKLERAINLVMERIVSA